MYCNILITAWDTKKNALYLPLMSLYLVEVMSKLQTTLDRAGAIAEADGKNRGLRSQHARINILTLPPNIFVALEILYLWFLSEANDWISIQRK